MIRLREPGDLTWDSVQAIAYDNAPVSLSDALLARVDAGRAAFLGLIEAGVPCYGVTTGLGQLVERELDEDARRDLPNNMLRARAAAVGPPLAAPVARLILAIRLVNFLSGLDGVRAGLCRFLVDRLNDGFTPWIPTLGHGMGADAVANCHAFQTFIGEGFVFGPDGQRQAAAEALDERGVAPLTLASKEGLALISGVNVAPALAIDAHRRLMAILRLANAVAALSMEGLAAPRDSIDAAIEQVHPQPGVARVATALRRYLAGSGVRVARLQAPVSYRIVPQIHGAFLHALDGLRQRVEQSLRGFTDNPLMVLDDSPAGGRLLSVGLFHDQHLVNQVEQVALALAHLGALAERRLHRLLNPGFSGLTPQLAPRPGLDAGLVVVQKASLDIVARLKWLAQPLSLQVGEGSGGQEDYMAMAFPAIQRLHEMAGLAHLLLAHELLTALVAVDQRGEPVGEGLARLRQALRARIPALDRDRAPGADLERLLAITADGAFQALLLDL